MVFIKKGQTPNKTKKTMKGKKAPTKKAEKDFEEMNNSEDSDEAPELQKTPDSKGTKGENELSMSEKKVSFVVPKTVKTPKKGNPALSKKQPTPASKGKTSIQQLKGVKRAQPEKDEDEDDVNEIGEDDDDVDDLDMDAEDDEDCLGLEEDGSDKEESSKYDDYDEAEDESDSNDKDVEEIKNKIKTLNGKLKLSKNIEKTKQEAVDKISDLIKDSKVKESKIKNDVLLSENDRRRQTDTKKVFIGKLPNDVTQEELKSLSEDIVEIQIPHGSRKSGAFRFAYLVFDSEAKAEANYKALQTKTLKDQALTVDLVGHKSLRGKSHDLETSDLDLKKLFIPKLPVGVTLDQVAGFFKSAQRVALGFSSVNRCATVSFFTEESAKEAYDANREIEISSRKYTVMYSRKLVSVKGRKRYKGNKEEMKPENRNGAGRPFKKMKFGRQ